MGSNPAGYATYESHNPHGLWLLYFGVISGGNLLAEVHQKRLG